MSNNAIGIPKYDLTKFKKVHRQDNTPSSPFGYNQIDPSKTIGGFEIYSSEGLIGSMGPLKSQFYRVSITVTGSLDMQIRLDHYKHKPKTLALTFPR
jgi:AraC family transcriptional regulator, transcriptional activator of pobA